MGSFSFTCAISGLPIEAGDSLRVYLLSESPYDEMMCGMDDRWFPRSFPLKGKYDDYGGVSDIEDGPAKDLWMDCFQKDMKRRGWGDNTCHDVPTSKTMSFDEMMNAVSERRVRVSRDLSRPTLKDELEARGEKQPGVPTIRDITEVLTKAGGTFYKGNFGSGGFVVTLLKHGQIQVRWEEFDKKKAQKKLEESQELLSEYATIIVAGDQGDPELIVYPKPGTKGYHGPGHSTNYRGLRVECAMVREDVWQALCARELDRSDFAPYKKGIMTEAAWRTYTFEFWKECAKARKKFETTEDGKFKDIYNRIETFLYAHSHDPKNPIGWYVGKDAIPFTVGLGTNWRLMLDKWVKGGVTDPQLDEWLHGVAEFTYVSMLLRPVRYYWRPSYSCGPQVGMWTEHERFLQSILDVTTRNRVARDEAVRKDEEDFAKWEAEEKAKNKSKKAKTAHEQAP